MEKVIVIGGKGSLSCIKVEWALKLKGVEYEYLEEDLLNKSPMLLKFNPVHKKIPTLVHCGKGVAESLVILEYIDQTWKDHPLLPQDPYERAMARFWAKFAAEKILPGAFGAFSAEGKEKEKAVESALESMAFLEKQIEGKKFFGGEEIGYLDLVLGWIPHWLNVLEELGGMKILDPQRFPCIHEWSDNFIQIPIIKECLPPREKLVNYFNAGLSYLRSLAANKS